MRRGMAMLAGAALAVAASSPPAEPSAASGPVPRLVLDAEAIDLGAIPQGEEAVATFELRNSGDALLAILSAKPS